jgi:FAD/FMN-containing dehydrogenase
VNPAAATTPMLDALISLLGVDAVLTAASDRAGYEKGWRYGEGRALAVVRPRSAQEVARVLALAAEHGVPVNPIGANTGLVGASNPDASGEQIALSLERLSKHIEIDPVDRTVVVDAGVTLSALNAALAEHGLFFPIDLGADPQIGGMIATNTGGTRLLRYGAVRENLLGVEVALPDGTLVDRLSRLVKDNTGLDWKQLFVGTFGSFGIVTRAVLKVQPLPRQTATAWVGVNHAQAVLDLLARFERHSGGTLSAFEVLSADALNITIRHAANLEQPFEANALPAYAALVELSTTLDADLLDLDAVLLSILEAHFEAAEDDLADVYPMAPAVAWNLRHHISESLALEGVVLALDISVPRARMAEFSTKMRAQLASSHPLVRVCDFGHWGDGGSHFNLVWPRTASSDHAALKLELQELIYEVVVRDYAGSYSAEHGVGPHNQRFYDLYTPAPLKAVAGVLKTHFDPERLLGRVRLD